MNDLEIINLWKSQNVKIEKSILINNQFLKEVIDRKVKSALESLKGRKIFGIIAFTVYIFFLSYLVSFAISHYSSAWNYFILSVSSIILINIKGLIDYIKHLYWTWEINYDGTVTEIQQQLVRLQLSIIDHTKIMCLQFPFFTTFYLSDSWFPGSVCLSYIFFQVILTGSFIILSYWLYKNHKKENLDKKWFRNMIAGSGGNSIMKAIEFYREIDEFKQGNKH